MYNHGTKKRSEGLYHFYTLYQYHQSHSNKHSKSENPVLAVPTVLRPALKPSLPTSMAPPNLCRHSGVPTAFKKSVFASDHLIHGDAPWNWIQCPHNCSLIGKKGNNHPGVHQINGVLPHARHGQGREDSKISPFQEHAFQWLVIRKYLRNKTEQTMWHHRLNPKQELNKHLFLDFSENTTSWGARLAHSVERATLDLGSWVQPHAGRRAYLKWMNKQKNKSRPLSQESVSLRFIP